MPGKEIKGRSKIATYRHGGRVDLQEGGPPGEWKKPKKGLTLENIEDLKQLIEDKSTKIKLRTPMGKKKLPSYKKGGRAK